MNRASEMSRKESKISRCIKAPVRILSKARDLYIRSLSSCGGNVGYGGGMGCPAPHVYTLPRSFSATSSASSRGDEDLRELIRAASARSLGNKIEMEFLKRQQSLLQKEGRGQAQVVPRSQSVGIGRIDEEKACDFGDDAIKVLTQVYPRSRSYAVPNRGAEML